MLSLSSGLLSSACLTTTASPLDSAPCPDTPVSTFYRLCSQVSLSQSLTSRFRLGLRALSWHSARTLRITLVCDTTLRSLFIACQLSRLWLPNNHLLGTSLQLRSCVLFTSTHSSTIGPRFRHLQAWCNLILFCDCGVARHLNVPQMSFALVIHPSVPSLASSPSYLGRPFPSRVPSTALKPFLSCSS